MVRKGVTEQFRHELASGTIVVGGKLPTFRELAVRYACSPATVKRMVDQLQLEGLLRTVRGAGTFVTARHAVNERPRRRQIAAIVLDDQSQAELARLKEAYLPLGWMFSIYNASVDAQSPEREEKFLKLVLAQDFEAVILEATPIAPTNADLFLQLRHHGTKVIHVSPYCDRMSAECYFMPDFFLAGQQGVLQLAAAGYRSVVFCCDGLDSPFVHAGCRGAAQVAERMRLHFEIRRERLSPGELSADVASGRSDKTAFFCVNDALGGRLVKAGAAERGIGLLAFCHSCELAPEISYFDFPFAELFTQAIDYATDPRRGALDLEQRLFAPIFRDLQSF